MICSVTSAVSGAFVSSAALFRTFTSLGSAVCLRHFRFLRLCLRAVLFQSARTSFHHPPSLLARRCNHTGGRQNMTILCQMSVAASTAAFHIRDSSLNDDRYQSSSKLTLPCDKRNVCDALHIASKESTAATTPETSINPYELPIVYLPCGNPGRIFSTSVCGLGITCCATSSPRRLAAAAPDSTDAFTAPTSPRTITVTSPGSDLFCSNQRYLRRLCHCVRCLDRCRKSSCLYHSQCFLCHFTSSLSAFSRLANFIF